MTSCATGHITSKLIYLFEADGVANDFVMRQILPESMFFSPAIRSGFTCA